MGCYNPADYIIIYILLNIKSKTPQNENKKQTFRHDREKRTSATLAIP